MGKMRGSEDVEVELEDNLEHVGEKRGGRQKVDKKKMPQDTKVMTNLGDDHQIGDGTSDVSISPPLFSSTFAADYFAANGNRTKSRTKSHSQTPFATPTGIAPSPLRFSRSADIAYRRRSPTQSYPTAPDPHDEIEDLELAILDLLALYNAKREKEEEVRKMEDQMREDEDQIRRKQNERRHAEYLRRESEDKERLWNDAHVEALKKRVKELKALVGAVEPVESAGAQRNRKRKLEDVFLGIPDIADFGPLGSEINRLFLSALIKQTQTMNWTLDYLHGFPLTEKEQEFEYLRIPPAPIHVMKFHELSHGRVCLPALVFKRDLHDFESLSHTGVKYFYSSLTQPGCLKNRLYGVARQFDLDGEQIRQYCCSECPIPVFRETVDHIEHKRCHTRIFGSLL